VEIVLSALKKCEHRDSIVLRLFNPTDRDIHAEIKFYHPIQEAWLTNMNEERREKLVVSGKRVAVHFGPKQIITCEVVLQKA